MLHVLTTLGYRQSLKAVQLLFEGRLQITRADGEHVAESEYPT